MAGKLHKMYKLNGGRTIPPGDRRARAYAEGYVARRNNKLRTTNPHPTWQNTDPIVSAWGAWDQGWIDADVFSPSSHVGLPDCTV